MPVIIDGTNGITQAGEFNSDSSFGFKNRLINGQMTFDQRNAGASVVAGAGNYTLDRWNVYNSTDGAFTVQQVSTAPAGFVNSAKITITTADTSLATAQYSYIRQCIEGYNIADLGWGTASAKTVTLSFWVQSSVTGTFSGAVSNDSYTRGYPFTYAISAANTWEQKSITITGSTDGTWPTNNTGSLQLLFSMGTGSTQSGTASAWGTTQGYVAATGSVNLIGTNGATLFLTGVQLEVGSTATSFDYRPYGTELALCQRYYYQVAAGGSAYTQFGAGRAFSTTGGNGIVQFPMPMRTAPTFSYLGSVGNYDFSPTAIASGAVPSSNTHMTVGMTFSSITSGSMFWLGQNASSTPCGFTFSGEL